MIKKALIDKTQYFSKATTPNTFCHVCKRAIHSKKCYCTQENSDALICCYCYGRIVSDHIQKQKSEAQIINEDSVIYVGVREKHICNGSEIQLADYYGKFNKKRNNQAIILPIKMCEKCGKIFLSGKYYEKNKIELQNYSFINSRTGKPYLELKVSENYNPRYKSTTKREIPKSIIWSVSHPFQSGGCSGK